MKRSTIPARPNAVLSWPVLASRDTSWKPGVTTTIRSSPLPSVQYATPRCTLRGAWSKRAPSSGRHVHNVSPVVARAATTVRRAPAVKYRTPFTISGVVSVDTVSLAGPPKLSNFQVHATCRFLTLSRLIRSSAE